MAVEAPDPPGAMVEWEPVCQHLSRFAIGRKVGVALRAWVEAQLWNTGDYLNFYRGARLASASLRCRCKTAAGSYGAEYNKS